MNIGVLKYRLGVAVMVPTHDRFFCGGLFYKKISNDINLRCLSWLYMPCLCLIYDKMCYLSYQDASAAMARVLERFNFFRKSDLY